MREEDLCFAGVSGQASVLRDKTVSCVELTRIVLERIQEYDGTLNACTVVLAEQALAEAAVRDADTGERGPLHGVPVVIKEEVDVAGQVTTYGGRANLAPAVADGELVRRLRAAGAVVVAKTNMPEFGQWPFTESVAHGITRNPWDPTRSTGGSSGGTAAAVAAGMVAAGIGGDGGGSLRIPAACCGLFGLKPQRGRVTSAPYPHLWWALGTAGPLTRSVRDSALIYDVVHGAMPGDRFRAAPPQRGFVDAVDRGLSVPRRLRIGVCTSPVTRGVHPDPANVTAVRETADVLAGLGHRVEEVEPHYPDPTAAFVPQFFGGVRAEAELVDDPSRLERRTRQTVRLGMWARRGVVEWAIRHGERVSARANRIFATHDLLLTPTIACRPPRIGVLDGVGTLRASLRAMPMIAYTALWNVTGNPAASVPAGIGDDGLPLACQLVGRPDDEGSVLAVSAQLEAARPWAEARPPLVSPRVR